MLKLRSPIKTSLKPDLLSSQEAFCERIKGNYMQLGGFVDETDLLHLVTSPPEVFIAEGGMTSIITNANTENNQIRKVNIINNLLNRITVSADSELSYQDKVYITNILHRLGVKDERKFMKQVYRITNEYKEQNETLKLYWENLNDIRNMIREYRISEDIRVRNDSEVLNSNVLHLHEEINRRLNTAAIYRILQNFYENTSQPRTVTSTEYRITEQERLTRHMVLNRLRETVTEEAEPLVYRNENIYEGDVEGEEVTNVTEVSERITSAVLLSLVENIYENTYERLNHDIKNWLSVEDVFYGAADNTLFRIENNTAYLQYLHEEFTKNEGSQSFYRNESDTIKQLLSISRNSNIDLFRTDTINISENGETIREYLTEREEEAPESTYPETSTGSSAESSYPQTDSEGEKKTPEEIRRETEQKLYQTYQQNIARNERYMQSLRTILRENPPARQEGTSAERTMRDSFLALEHPEEFRAQYEEAERLEAQRTEIIRTETEKLFSPIERVTHELIREYLRAPERFTHSDRMSVNNMGLLLYDIKQAEEQERNERAGITPSAASSAENAPSGGEPKAIFPVGDTNLTFNENETNVSIENGGATYSNVLNNTEVEYIFPVTEAKEYYLNMPEGAEGRISEATKRAGELRRGTGSAGAVEETYEDRSVSIVHRSMENTISEETIENLREEMKRIEETGRKTVTSFETNETENRTIVNNITNETIENNTRQIETLVNKQLRTQLDSISDKVYNRIEKQLKNEQRRRGL